MSKDAPGLISFTDLGGLDPAISSVLGGYERQEQVKSLSPEERAKERKKDQKKAKARKKMRARLPYRAVYDLPPGMKDHIEAIAAEEDTTASQIAGFLLAHALEMLDAGKIEIHGSKTPARSPHYSWKLLPPDGWKQSSPPKLE